MLLKIMVMKDAAHQGPVSITIHHHKVTFCANAFIEIDLFVATIIEYLIRPNLLI